MPRVSRTMDQVQQLSEKLVSRIQHRDTTTDDLASARLLSQQGVNQRQYVLRPTCVTIFGKGPIFMPDCNYTCVYRLSKALSNFEMKPTYEDVYQTQHSNVDEYLRHVQQATLLSAIHVNTCWLVLQCLDAAQCTKCQHSASACLLLQSLSSYLPLAASAS